MKNTVQIFFKTLQISIILFSLLTGCTQLHTDKPKTQETQNKKPKMPLKTKADKAPFISLTEANLEKELLRYGDENKETLVILKTLKGEMKIKLYENTPFHRANFVRLVKNNFYKETQFYRVINNFMIQGGDNDDWSRQSIKTKMGTYTLPAEFRSENIHKKGAISMAREYENNPDKRSVSFEWFIVQGTKYTDGELLGAEKQYGIKISPEHKEIYKTVGGTPHLDGMHTVFAQVIEGLDVIDSIAAVKVDDGDWPIENITIEFQLLE